jgi:hypothetical protein
MLRTDPEQPYQPLNGLPSAMAKAIARYKRAREDKIAFMESLGRNNEGQAIRLAEIHRQWLRHIDYCWDRQLRAIILAPFGHGKSTVVVPLIAWLIGQDTNRRVKVITNDDGSASQRVNVVKRIIESPGYRNIFKDVKRGGKWTDHELYVRRHGQSIDPTLHARGVFTTGIGGRADIEVFDDVVDQKNSIDPAQRKRVLNFVEQTWLNRLEPTGKALFIGTVWHAGDTYHVLKEKPGYCTLIQRVSNDCTCIEQEVVGVVDSSYTTRD